MVEMHVVWSNQHGDNQNSKCHLNITDYHGSQTFDACAPRLRPDTLQRSVTDSLWPFLLWPL